MAVTLKPGQAVETLHKPAAYSREQIRNAARTVLLLDRGKLILCRPPLDGCDGQRCSHQDHQERNRG